MDGDNIKINLLYNYAVSAAFGLDKLTNTAGEPVRGFVTLLENGAATTNERLYSDSVCTFILTDTVTGAVSETPIMDIFPYGEVNDKPEV